MAQKGSWLLATGCWLLALCSWLPGEEAQPRCLSGIYPNLAMYNNEGECGTGAVVPWAGRLWVVTYGPHCPKGSSDKLYEITPDFQQVIRPESIGGTHANRMIHTESKQLFIGYHAIAEDGTVRTIPWKVMPGRLTGTARHLTDPANRIYTATMEEGLYEIDVKTLEVKELIRDGNIKDLKGLTLPETGFQSKLPGYHGKGLFTGQGRLIYANNGEQDGRVATDPTIASGALAEWRGQGDWCMVRRNQFTEVRGPGDICGNANPETDPVWALGWDFRSVILMLLDGGQWHAFRLPKGSHSYDGSHGWNTEWPRTRDIGETDMLATMHGTFWRFPKTFSLKTSAGIAPRSNYLKVIGDFCRWNDRVVCGCDDSAKSEFMNTRPFKSSHCAPDQSNSNLWFLEPARLDQLGPAIGRGSVWLRDDVKAGVASDPYLFAGYDRRMLHLTHHSDQEVKFTIEVDRRGEDRWETLRTIAVPAKGYAFHVFTDDEKGAWVRLKTDLDARQVAAVFQYAKADQRPAANDAIFAGITAAGTAQSRGGIVRALGGDRRVLGLAGVDLETGKELGYYELDASLKLARKDDAEGRGAVMAAAPPAQAFQVDEASVIVTEDGKRFRIPKNPAYLKQAADGAPAAGLSVARVCREVATERDLFNCHGTFFELPARNASGFLKIRPIATHNLAIHDYASYRGLMLITGLDPSGFNGKSEHIIGSDDGKCAVWAGVIDDLWKLGKPRGEGGPWKGTRVQAGVPSDMYLMTGYDKKTLTLSHADAGAVNVTVEVDPDGTGLWCVYRTFAVEAGQPTKHEFPEGFNAYWVRVKTDRDCTATAQLRYE